jgi:mono/diheme cytochrome c family protein
MRRITGWLVISTALAMSAAVFSAMIFSSVARAQMASNRLETEHVIPSVDGPTLYSTYCAVCHGKAADGQGPMASILRTRVPDLTAIARRNGGTFPFSRVQKTIDGTESIGLGHGTSEMPIWGPLFSQVTTDRDFGKVRVYNLARYLQSIQK